MTVDLVMTNCRIVGPGSVIHAGIAVDSGKIVAVATEANLPKAARVIDAKGNYVLPGIIDPHVHIGLLQPFEKEIATETRSAAAGGVTTMLPYLIDNESYDRLFHECKRQAEKDAFTDFSFHLATNTHNLVEQIPQFVKWGVNSFKFFMAYGTRQESEELGGIPHADDGVLYAGFKKIGGIGSHLLALVHAENSEIIDVSRREAMASGGSGLDAWAAARPPFVEEDTLRRAIFMAKVTKCPLYVVHMSIGEGPDLVAQANVDGTSVIAETCPHYLIPIETYEKRVKVPILAKHQPPVKHHDDTEKLWQGIRNGSVKCIGTDHAVFKLEQKIGKGDVWSAKPGCGAYTELLLPLMITEGVCRERISIEKLVEVCSYNNARAFGLYPRKGTIQVGSDADLVVVDINAEKEVRAEKLHSAQDYSLFEGWRLKGWPMITMIRGDIVAENGEIIGKSGGRQYIAR